MSASNFGDGSNRWIDGFVETVRNPVDRATNPVETVTGAADAAALNFDEGVGGLVSLVDDDPGNTAGVGQQGLFEDDAANPDSVRGLIGYALGGLALVALVVAVGQLFTINIGDSTS